LLTFFHIPMLSSLIDRFDESLATRSSPARRAGAFGSILGLVLVAALILNGCVSSAVQQGLDSAGEAAGQTVGEALGAEIVRAADLPPPGSARYNQVMVQQAQIMFSYAFSAGGMWPAEAQYEPGEWTTYRVGATGGETALDTLERAFLRRTDDGNEWWRVRGVQNGEDWIYEALLDPEQETIVRMRGKDPEGEVGEVPVTEETVYRSPQQLTEESVEGATEGTESVDTPAGTFTARRVEYSGRTSGGTVTWFLSDEVPGHVVQYEGRREGEAWTSTLLDYGTDATTALDSY
jgi:hypothetical protein